MTDREPDLDALLRSDAQVWREQVDSARPDIVPTPVRKRSASPYVAGLIAAVLVAGLAVLVVSLRPDHKGTIAAGGPVSSAAPAGSSAIPNPLPSVSATVDPGGTMSAPTPVLGHVPGAAYCPTDGSSAYGSGFSVSFAGNRSGSATIEAAAAKFPPRDAQWTVVARDDRAALLTYGSQFLHVIRLPDGTWAVDSGGNCGGADATIAR
ncbi:MAG TPA: hypothetical protein VGH43_13580 [Jatrophihabitans sp.]|jgi:hypothetical protein